MKQLTLAIFILLSKLSFCNSYKTNTNSFLDSIYTYLDSVPKFQTLVNSEFKALKENPQTICFYPQEYTELKIHLKYAVLPKYSETERTSRLLNLIEYKMKEEVNQYNVKKVSVKDKFDIISDSSIYRNKGYMLESYWANSTKMLILIGQTHSYSYSEEENIKVSKIQNEMFSLQEILYNNGINLFMEEGYLLREVDYRIPTNSSRAEINKDINHKMQYEFDSTHNAIFYGIEDKVIAMKGDSLMKFGVITRMFFNEKNQEMPMKKDELLLVFHSHISTILSKYPHFKTNLDTARMFKRITEHLITDTIITKDMLYNLSNKFFCDANRIILNERNKDIVLNKVDAIFRFTNRDIAIVRIGAAHLDRKVNDVIDVGFENELITIQDFCKKNNISFIYLVTPTQFESLR